MTRASSKMPPAVAQVLGHLPGYPGSLLFSSALNLAMAQHLPPDVRAALEGKTLRIRVTDAGIGFDFSWRGTRFCAVDKRAVPDLTIAASAQDFLLLAQRREDPDTLFFSRRLAMEGDTELGLLVKNTLDAMEMGMFETARQVPARLFARARQAFGK
ncbi:MAG: SCP2 sterol-binding domain-containing protein [Pseudomonadota bacterium]